MGGCYSVKQKRYNSGNSLKYKDKQSYQESIKVDEHVFCNIGNKDTQQYKDNQNIENNQNRNSENGFTDSSQKTVSTKDLKLEIWKDFDTEKYRMVNNLRIKAIVEDFYKYGEGDNV